MTQEPDAKKRKMPDSTMSETENKSMIDPAIFLRLQESIDRDSAFKDSIREVTNDLDRINREMTFSLAQVHTAASSKISETLDGCRPHFEEQKSKIAKLAGLASQMPYYKFNNLFINQLQNASFTAIYAHWLGCDLLDGETRPSGTLLRLEEVAKVLGVEVNVGDKDVFHLTIEEYLHSLVTLINELSRLAVTSVTNGNYRRPLEISSFIKDLFSAFQILNLKNDSLRRRYDSIKYDVKKVEEVVYDLSLRGLTGDASDSTKQVQTMPPYLKVKTLTETAKLPTRGSTHAAGYDMYASSAIEIPAGGRALVCTGLSIAVPEDCYARVAPRSGLAVKNGIQTGAGVVDSDYRGEVRVLLFNQGTESFVVNVGDRIAQLVLERVYTPLVQQTDNLEESIRGAGGFGSTGT